MKTKLQTAIIGGITATVVMTIVTFLGPMMGMPEMDPPKMLSVTMGFPIAVGWIMHFMIGIIFALGYAYAFLPIAKKLKNNIAKGVIYGIIIFVVAQVMMQVMGAIFDTMPPSQGNMVLLIIGSLMGHVIFGITVALFFKDQSANKTEET